MVLRKLFKQDDNIDAEFSRGWFANVSTVRQIVFECIESAVIVAALQVAWEKTGHIAFCIIWLIAFLALTAYLQNLVKWLINETNERFDLVKDRTKFSYVAGTTSTIFSAFSVWIVSNITSSFITASFMQ